jgi:hypothetical protein
MATITLEVPDELLPQIRQLGDRFPEWLALSFQQPSVPARLYREILGFLASNPTPEAILAFQPNPEIQARLRILLDRNAAATITPSEIAELDEYEEIEHFMIRLKQKSLKQQQNKP